MNPASPALLADPVARLLSHLELGEARWMVALAGLPGSGKSTFAARLAHRVNARAGADVMLSLSMDGFHLPQAALRQMPDPQAAFARRGAPWTFDVAGLAARLQMLREQGEAPVAWPGFEHEVGDPVEAALLVSPATRLILVEGLYLLQQSDGWDAVGQTFDERWYLDTPLELSLERLVARHRKAWNIGENAAKARVESNDSLNAGIVGESRAHADWRLAPDEMPF